MNVGELIKQLKRYDPKLPIAINDNMDFVEAYLENIKIERKRYRSFPFTENDEFEYINLRNQEIDN